jgi:hypothetical protein
MKCWLQLSEDVAVMQFPMRAFGIDFLRNVTLLRLRNGSLIIHSTAPFEPDDESAIGRFGEPGWLVEATVMHDTFAKKARATFPTVPYLAPPGLRKSGTLAVQPLHPAPDGWSDEVEVLEMEGLRWPNEHVFYHRAARILVVADLLFHFPPDTHGWPRFFVRHVMRLPRLVGISSFFGMMIRDKEAFSRSIRKLLERDFQQIAVAHAEPLRRDGKVVLMEACRERGIPI